MPARPKAPSCGRASRPAGRGRRGRAWASPVGNLYSSTILRPDCPAAARRRTGLRRGPGRGRHRAGRAAGAREMAQRRAGRRRQGRRHPARERHRPDRPGAARRGRHRHQCRLRARSCPRCAIPARRWAARSRRRWRRSPRRLPQRVWPSGGATASRRCAPAWLAKAGPLGAEVDVKLGDELVRGRFAGLDREGALLLETAAGPRRIVSGELLGRAA